MNLRDGVYGVVHRSSNTDDDDDEYDNRYEDPDRVWTDLDIPETHYGTGPLTRNDPLPFNIEPVYGVGSRTCLPTMELSEETLEALRQERRETNASVYIERAALVSLAGLLKKGGNHG